MSWGYKPRRTLYAGGSGLLGMKPDGSAGWLKTYHLNRPVGQGILKQAFDAHQRALKIVVSFLNGGGTDDMNLDSSGGIWKPRDAANLAALLSDIKANGFEEVILAYCPAEGGENGQMIVNGPFAESLYSETWNFIVHGAQIMEASGLSYRVDLQNEPWNNPNFVTYCQRLWGDGLNAIQNSDYPNLLGVHFSVGDWNNLDQIFKPYGQPAIYPSCYFVHAYDNLPANAAAIKAKLQTIGEDHKPWYIDECSDNDVQTAGELVDLSRTTTLVRRLAWPLIRGGAGNQNTVSIDESAYISVGL